MLKRFNLKKYFFIILQALSAVLTVACICIYNYFSTAYTRLGDDYEKVQISLDEYRLDYYDSEVHTTNMYNTVSEVLRYSVIRHQLETDGEYDPDKIIFIGKYAHRADETPYTGPDAAYYLKDLIAWGQFGISTNGISHSYQVFNSWEELNSFFGQSNNTTSKTYDSDDNVSFYISESNDVDEDGNVTKGIVVTQTIDDTIPMLDVISNRYLSCQGQNLEFYAHDVSDYSELVNSLEIAATSLYTNYKEYLDLKDRYDPDNTNIRYYIKAGNNKNDIFTNLLNYNILDSDKMADTFKSMGEYIYACPRNIDYLTNTLVNYEDVKTKVMEYSYYLPDDTVIWVGLDTSYPVHDLFYDNYSHLHTAVRIIPFIITFAVIGLLSFIVLFFVLLVQGRQRIRDAGNIVKLRFTDTMPVETQIILCAIIMGVVYLISLLTWGDETFSDSISLKESLTHVCVSVFLYVFTGLNFLYLFIRRAYLKLFFKNSVIVGLLKWMDKHLGFVKRAFWRVYDSSNIAIRTWALYLGFIIFNAFWACMLFFSNFMVIAFLVLFIFDGLTGVLLFNRGFERKRIFDAVNSINEGQFDTKLDTSKMHGDNKTYAEIVNKVGDSVKKAVETSSKDEKLKADLITNVSHDIKTPLTSIINYVDLIKRENIDNERVKNYVRILDEKSQRLKQLTVDLVEASKITSGNITLELAKMNVNELIYQAQGEFEEKYESRGLALILSMPKEPVVIEADPRYVWRILENLMQNAYKYALKDTRVYLDLTLDDNKTNMIMSLKNISSNQLNINADELTERFIRGDVSRSSEGSGLGLSIVKSLAKAHNGSFEIYLDGDLFKATVILPVTHNKAE